MGHALEFFDDPHAFLAAAEPLLAAEPVRCTVVASVTARYARGGGDTRPPGEPARWWALVRDDEGRAVSAAMRTAPLPPYPPYLLGMPEDAARLLARVLHERGEGVEVVNGYVPTIDEFVDQTVALSGGTPRETERTSLYEVTELADPPAVPGRLRLAREDEVDLVQDWFDAFGPDASEQAGRADPHPAIETRESTRLRILAGDVWLWEVGDRPVSVTAFNPPSFGVARVGPVYTPKEHRGHGYAAAGVSAISRRLLDEGARVCLFADERNQTSTGVYLRLGYRPIAVTGGLRIDRGQRRISPARTGHRGSMQPQAGWVTDPGASDPLAHQLAPPSEDAPVGTLCGRYSDSWDEATPGIERCQDCQLVAAGPTPD